MKYCIVLFLFVLCGRLSAQDPVFSQFYAVPLRLNPAIAGAAFAPRISTIYRHQWTGFSNAYRTYALTYEQQIDRLNSGVGLTLEGDNAGDGIYKTVNISAVYAYRLNINDDWAVKLGVEGAMHQTSLDWDKLIFPDQIDPVNGIQFDSREIRPDIPSNARLDVSAGMLLLNEYFYLGGALKHINTPNTSILLFKDNLIKGLPIRYVIHGGGDIIVKPGNKRQPGTFISPNFLFAAQGPYKQLNIGAYAGLGAINAGVWFRHTLRNADALILSAGFRQDVYRFGISYDATVSKLASRSGGAWELSFGVLLDKNEHLRKKKKRADINDCLKMFQ